MSHRALSDVRGRPIDRGVIRLNDGIRASFRDRGSRTRALVTRGFSRVEEVGPGELLELYLAGRPDAQLTGIERLATAWV
ncbi:MAG: hypothetical protein ACREOY_14985 [Candidatus Dormibacteraceae bacterium]